MNHKLIIEHELTLLIEITDLLNRMMPTATPNKPKHNINILLNLKNTMK